MGNAQTRILVVDDNRDLVDTTVHLLRSMGHDAMGYYSGISASSCVTEFDPDIVLLDIGLPGQSGWAVARQIRERMPGKRPVLIGHSGAYTTDADKALAEVVGFDYYVVKGPDAKELISVIEKAQARLS